MMVNTVVQRARQAREAGTLPITRIARQHHDALLACTCFGHIPILRPSVVTSVASYSVSWGLQVTA